MTNEGNGRTVLGDPARRAIFERLAERARSVGELARQPAVIGPAVSHQFWNQALALFKTAVEQQQGGLMTMQATATSVQSSITVDAPIERAFSLFTDGIATWWPPEHHLLQGELAEMVFEPREGGSIYDRAVDGSECRWARVLAYEPPNRVLFSWNISPQWQIETDRGKVSEVEVRFTAEGPDRTRVELEHSKLERHGEGWEGMRDGVASPDGWGLGLRRFAEAARS
jgi:uncharacterized protein YndB with AHSA1/START domain